MAKPVSLVFDPVAGSLEIHCDNHSLSLEGFLKGTNGLHSKVIGKENQIKLIKKLVESLPLD